jgi:hypothetical protein
LLDGTACTGLAVYIHNGTFGMNIDVKPFQYVDAVKTAIVFINAASVYEQMR